MPHTKAGKPAPDFDAIGVLDGRLKDISLKAYGDAGHWLCLVFFPMAWSFICPTEIRAFNARLEEFLYTRQCAVAFISTDNQYSLKSWATSDESCGGLGNNVHVPLISDSNHSICKAYGVLDEEQGVAHRALFIIDPKGTVRSCTINDSQIGRNVDETLRVIDALAFKDSFGEGCPADWKKGDAGIKLAELTKVEGPIDLSIKKTWKEWARPKLNRAWSQASSSQPTSPVTPSGSTGGGYFGIPGQRDTTIEQSLDGLAIGITA